MLVEIIFWIGGIMCTTLYCKAKNQIIKIMFKKTLPLMICYTKTWHDQNRFYLNELYDKSLYLLEWVLID